MDQRFFRIPFGTTGDRLDVPTNADPGGLVSYEEGYGPKYSLNLQTDPLAESVKRTNWNGILFDITQALGALQKTGAPEWITAANNGGVALEYAQGATVAYRALPADPWIIYQSLVPTNTFTPGTDPTKWAPISGIPARVATLEDFKADLEADADFLEVTATGITPTDKRTLGQWFGDLLSSAGAAMVGFVQAGTGAVMRFVQDKLRERVSILDFMSDAERADSLLVTPVLDHGVALQKAIDAVSSGVASGLRGRAIIFPGGRSYLINSAVTLRSGTAFIGEFDGLQDNYAANEPVKPAVIYVGATGSITGSIGVFFKGLFILRAGLTIPQSAAQVATWTGTGVTLPNNGASIENCLIAGFSQAVLATNHSRLRMRNVLIDCLNGVDNSGSFDITYLERVHCWPYLSVGAGDSNALKRPGSAFKIHDIADWAKLTDCFSYGYFRGYDISNANDVTLIGCSADNVIGHAGARGFSITGNCIGIRLIAPQAAAQETGIYSNQTGTANSLSIVNYNAWTNANESLRLDGTANFSVIGGNLRGSTNAIVCNNASISGLVSGVRFGNTITADCINYQTATDNVRVESVSLESGGTGRIETSTKTAPQIASASTLILNQYFDVQTVTGTTNINAISGALSKVGRVISLHFTGALTVANNANIVLKGGAPLNTASGTTLHFANYGGGVWREI